MARTTVAEIDDLELDPIDALPAVEEPSDMADCVYCKRWRQVCCADGFDDRAGTFVNPSCADCCQHPVGVA